ncbi:MAG: hypothetical protein IPO21_00005, partial [Bacteroidales bacterium]|nr:hypothetical protein [Bacteroidales bacterium]
MASLSHTIAGNIANASGGVLNSSTANFVFDGGNQDINTPNFSANNVTILGTGTKRLFSNWTLNGSLLISASTLNNSDGLGNYYSISLAGNWTNSSSFSHNDQSFVAFNATTDVQIDNGTGTFWETRFGNDAGSTNTYTLTNATTIRRTATVNEDAYLFLNGKTLTFGFSTANPKLFTVKGVLDVNANARLLFQNQGSICSLLVDNAASPENAILRIVGDDAVNVATISRSTAGGQFISIDNATIEAQYYAIEYLANTGIEISSNATLHTINNFSNGTFSNINNVAGACYLNLEASIYAGSDIENVTFNISTPPVAGIYNVKRQTATPNIAFAGVITGDLGGYKYEKDELTATWPAALVDANQGKLQWPPILETVWTGSINSDWSNPGNWSNGVPNSGLDAIIPSVVNYPILDVNAVCKKLRITSGILELVGGFDIIAHEDINIGESTSFGKLIVSDNTCKISCGGSWSRGTNGNFIHGDGTVEFLSSTGSATINPLSSNFYNLKVNNVASIFSLVGTTLNILGDIEITAGTLQPTTASYVLNLGGDFNSQGTFIPGTGTVVLNGNSDQVITNGRFYNLTVSGSNKKYITNACDITLNTIINSTLQASTASPITFNGNVTINAGATFNDGDESHIFKGSLWTGTGTYEGNGTISFNKTNGNQTVTAATFSNLIVNCTGSVFYLNGSLSIKNSMQVLTGVSRVDILNYLISNITGVGLFTVDNGVTVRITGADHFPKNFDSYQIAETSSFDYRGDVNQIIGGGSGINYGNLVLTNPNIKTLGGEIEILGNLTFNTATLDVSSNNYSITIAKNWYNDNVTGGIFIPHSGEVIFNGSS